MSAAAELDLTVLRSMIYKLRVYASVRAAYAHTKPHTRTHIRTAGAGGTYRSVAVGLVYAHLQDEQLRDKVGRERETPPPPPPPPHTVLGVCGCP